MQWGVTAEGHFFCKNCHSLIERTREVENLRVTGAERITSLRTGPRVKRAEGGRQWFVCEGFQFILLSQAEALLRLGVDEGFKSQVLVHLWRLYLHKTHQAFTLTPVRSATFRLRVSRPHSDTGLTSGSGLDSESGLDSQLSSSEGGLPSTAASVCSTGSVGGLSDWSVGSLDSDSYVSQTRRKKGAGLMSMRKTLALLYIALTWSRHSITLCDLLRLVEQGHVPYINAYECFPEEMKLSNRDALIFKVQSIPSYLTIHRESSDLIKFLQLPAFPPISSQSPLHPLNLSLRLLTDLNLPDQMAQWVESVLIRADLRGPARLTVDPSAQRALPHYELIAAAAVIVTMKLLFGLDDKTEWELSTAASDEAGVFSLRRWYRLLRRALMTSQRRELQLRARRRWIPKKPFYFTNKEKIVAMKRRRVAEQLTSCFKQLSSDQHGDTEGGGACNFRFLWGPSPNADGQSLHHMTLKGGARFETPDMLLDKEYWHPPFRHHKDCRSHLQCVRKSLPHSFLFVLRLVSHVLGVKPDLVLEATLKLERKLLNCSENQRRPRAGKKRRRTAESKSGTQPRKRKGKTNGAEIMLEEELFKSDVNQILQHAGKKQRKITEFMRETQPQKRMTKNGDAETKSPKGEPAKSSRKR